MIFLKRHKSFITINLSRMCFFNDIRMGFKVHIYVGFSNRLIIDYAGNRVMYEYIVKIQDVDELIIISFSITHLHKTFELNIIMFDNGKNYNYRCSKSMTHDGVETILTIKKTNKHDVASNIQKFPIQF